MKKRIATVLGSFGVAAVLVLGLATPSQAETRWLYWVSATDLWITEYPLPCAHSGEHYEFMWDNVGDKVYLRDCAANGWGTKISVEYSWEGRWLPAGTLHDPSADGDGGWKSFADIVFERAPIRLKAWEYLGDNRANQVTCIGLNSSDDRMGDCTDPVD